MLGPDDGRDEKGKTPIDVKSHGAYVVAAGSWHEKKQREYLASLDPATLDLSTLPVIDNKKLRDLCDRGRDVSAWYRAQGERASLGLALPDDWKSKPRPERTKSTKAKKEPQERSQGLYAAQGFVDGAIVVRTATGGESRIEDLGNGNRFASPFRPDANPSCTVYRGWMYDHSRMAKWEILTDTEQKNRLQVFAKDLKSHPPATGKSKPQSPSRGSDVLQPEHASSSAAEREANDLRKRFACDVEIIPADSWVSDQSIFDTLGARYPDGVCILLRAPMGKGKTEAGKKIMRRYKSGMTIANTVALTVAMSAQYEMDLYMDSDSRTAAKVATTLNSLPKIEFDPLKQLRSKGYARDFVVVDEADQVRDFLHSSKIRNALETKNRLIETIAAAKFSMITSADLDVENMAWYIDGLRQANPKMQFLVLVQAVTPGQRNMVLVKPSVACELLYKGIEEHKPEDPPIVAYFTSQRAPSVHARVLAEKRPDLRILWISSENSKREEIQSMLKDPNSILKSFDVILCSPSVQSGISFTSTVKQVFVIHSTDTVPPKTTAQMAMRCRSVQTIDVIYGIVPNRGGGLTTNPEWLERTALGLEAQTRKNMDLALPSYKILFETGERAPVDSHFMQSWILTVRRQREAMNALHKDTMLTFKRHGWTWEDKTNADADPEKAIDRREHVREAKEAIDLERCDRVAAAPDLSEEETQRIRHAYTATQTDDDALDRKIISEYYDREVTPELVALDDRGAFRESCKLWNRILLYGDRYHPESAGRKDRYLAFLDWRANRNKHSSEYKHTALRAGLFYDTLSAVLNAPISNDLEGIELWADDVQSRSAGLIDSEDKRLEYHEILGSRVSSKTVEQSTRWFNELCRKIGIEVTVKAVKYKGKVVRKYRYSFAKVHEYGEAERKRMQSEIEELQSGDWLWDSFVQTISGAAA